MRLKFRSLIGREISAVVCIYIALDLLYLANQVSISGRTRKQDSAKHLLKLEELAHPGASDRILSDIGRCCPKLMKIFFQVMSDNPKCYSMGILSTRVEDFVFFEGSAVGSGIS